MYRFVHLIGRCSSRSYSTQLTSLQLDTLDSWIATPQKLTIPDTVSPERLSDLYITLPTRDGILKPFRAPQVSRPIEYGHHIIFFHPRTPEPMLRMDGTDPGFCPPKPFTRRMWAGGRFEWNNANPLLVGSKAMAITTVKAVAKKRFEDGKPMVFVDQKIEIVLEDCLTPSLTEIRSHVYLPEASWLSGKPREVKDLPHKSHFSFTYRPTQTTLFRFSALTFNAHHIHLDKDTTQSREGYPERLVHGPLTALMLLEATTFHNQGLKLKSFDYRAVNPLVVNHEMTLRGTWLDERTAKLWCVGEDGTVGMTGSIEKAAE